MQKSDFDQPSKIVHAVIKGVLILCAVILAACILALLAGTAARTSTGRGCDVGRKAACFHTAAGRTEMKDVSTTSEAVASFSNHRNARKGVMLNAQARARTAGTLAEGNVAAPRPSTSNPAGATLLAYGSDEISTRRRTHRSHWARPHRWCGWYMRQLMGVSDPRFNLARNWARYGRPAYGPAPGVIVVWRGHVGKIVGPCHGSMCMVHSGNDGRAVRTRLRSVARAIAFRWPA